MPEQGDGPVFHVEPQNGLGKRMIQYIVALHFQSLVPGSRISNVQMPEWEIDHLPLPLRKPVEIADHRHHVEMAGLAERARSGQLGNIVYSGYGQQLENFLPLETCRAAFRAPLVSPARFNERCLVCHVRAGELIYGSGDPSYPLTPVEFYAAIVGETGLIPVFAGQTAPNDYTNRLRPQFPRGVFLETGDIILDFETIRQARNIVVGVSIYAWLAAWLSHADRIFMAVDGLFNPMQYDIADLLPLHDPRYRHYLFPINYAVPIERPAALHRRIAPLCRQVPVSVLRRMFREAPRFDPSLDQMAEVFDAEHYLKANADVAAAYAGRGAEGALEHYRAAGTRERRMPFALSAGWYAGKYPMAVMEVAQGDYSTFAHHYVAVGRARGYRKLPDDNESWWDTVRQEAPPAITRSIAVLAREVVTMEPAEPLPAQPPVRLGDSFAALLFADRVRAFAARTSTEPLRVFHLRGVLLDVSLMALCNGRYPISDTLYMVSREDYEYAVHKPLLPRHVDAEAHYIAGGNNSVHNYYHWMTQSLPAIDWGWRNRKHDRVVLALPPLEPWQEATLALPGCADVPRLTLLPSSHYALASAEFSEFLCERMAQIVSRTAAATYARLRDAVAPASDGAAEIYVARSDSNRRVAVNEGALIAVLERQGVRVIVPGAMPPTEQLAAFRAARLVVGPHGAGLSNIMGCVPGTDFYELLPSRYPNVCFNRLAQTCGLNYWADAFPAEDGPGNPHDRTWRIDLDVVAARLDEIRACRAAGGACPE
jgi:hypothetical protein